MPGITWLSSDGWSVTARAFSTTGTSAFQTAALKIFGSSGGQNMGLGVCNQNSTESVSSGNCEPDQWQIDNNSSARDFILFTFSQPVSVESLLLLQSSLTAHDSDVDYYFDTTANLSIVANVTALATLGAQGFGAVNNSNGGQMADTDPYGCNIPIGTPCPTRTVTLAANSGVYGLLVAAHAGQMDDYFKLAGLDAAAPVKATVPEPGSFALLGGGLLALGLVARRRKR